MKVHMPCLEKPFTASRQLSRLAQVGGTGGHMSDPDTAGFDPIFVFHHCNVDRLAAIWQYCYQKAWQEFKKKDPVTAKAPLTPFRKTAGNANSDFWTADDAEDILRFNVDYPELDKARENELTEDEFRAAMLCYYAPLRFDEVRWYLNLHNIPKNKFSGPYRVLAYIGLNPDQAKAAGTAHPNFVGEVSIFSRGKNSQCGNCKKQRAAGTDGIECSIDITAAVERLHISFIRRTVSLAKQPAPETPLVKLFDHDVKAK